MKRFIICTFILILFFSLIIYSQDGSLQQPNKFPVLFPFFDDVENSSTSSSYWQRDTTIWKILSATAHSGSHVWGMLPTTGSYQNITLATSVDLSSTSNPYISFWVRKADSGAGYLKVEVSTDGGSSWTSLLEQYFSGAQYLRFQVSLFNYRQANILIRIGGYAPSGGTYYLDDILIDNAPSPQPILLSSPTDNGMNVHWNQSSAADFYKYRIIVSTDANSVNNYYVTPSVNNRTEINVFDIFNQAMLDTVFTDLIFTNTIYYAKVYEQDTQDLVNQGSDRSDLSTSFNVTPQTSPFVQNFEGSYNWVADIPWAVTTDDAGDPGHSTTHAYEDSPQGNYPVNSDRRLTMQINLTSVQRPVLKFNHKYSFETGSDYGSLEISTDNVNWTTVTGFSGNIGGVWESRQYDVGVLKQQSTGYVRFKTTSNSINQQDGWHLDDVEIFNNTRIRAFPFFDDVEVDTFSQNNWIAGTYNLQLANAHSGAQVWSLKPAGGTYNFLTLSGKMNLSSAPNPYISLWAKKADGGAGYIRFEVSNDAGLTWTLLSEKYFSGTQYIWFETSLANYRQANVVVRVGCYAPSGGTYYIDDILIDNAPTPRSLVLITPTNNGMTARWGISTATDFGSYKVVLSTDQNQVNDYFSVTNLNNRAETRILEFFNQATIETTLTDLAFTNNIYYAKIYERDTQLLINQGSDRSDLSTAFNVVPEVAPFVQTFEGAYSWAADLLWAVSTDDAGDPGHSPTHAFEDSPGTNYPPNADRRLEMQMNTLAVQRPVLRFNHRYAFEPVSDFGYVEYSVDNVNWTTITGITGNTNTFWEQREFDIAPLKLLNSCYVRFRTTSNSANNLDGWHLDDVEVYNNTKLLGIPIIDDAEVDSVSDSFWLNGRWNIISANAHNGLQVWELPTSGGTYNYLTLKGLINLTSAPKPFISFWIKKADGGAGYVMVQASNDMGVTWTQLIQPYFSGANYTEVNASLNNYRQANVLIRIGGYSPSGGRYFVDDITIADSTGWTTTGIDDPNSINPAEFVLNQNYPNPFNPSTTISYSLPFESNVSITIYNMLGQQVAILENDVQSPGTHEIVFMADKLSSGVYFYAIKAVSSAGRKEFSDIKKLILLK